MTFQRFPHTNVLRRKLDLALKGQPLTFIYTNLVDLGSPNAIYQDLASKLSCFWRKRLLSVFTIYRHGGHLVHWRGTIRTNYQYLSNRRLRVKSGENCPKKVRGKSRKCHNHKPQPFPDTKRKKKQTKPNKFKSNKRTKSTKISSLSSPSEVIAMLKGLKNTRTK